MRRLLVVLLVVVVGVACGSELDTLPVQDASAFRRCWPAIAPNVCTGGVAPSSCRNDSEWRYARAAPPERRAWLTEYGCAVRVLENR